MIVTNCTLFGNAAVYDLEIGGGAVYSTSNDLVLTNCILWGDTPNAFSGFEGSAVMAHCNVEGGYIGEGSIAADPLFVDAAGTDGLPGTDDDDLRLAAGSPCIDAGDNGSLPADAADLDGDGDTGGGGSV